MAATSCHASCSFEDLLEVCVDAEAAQLYAFDAHGGRHGQRKVTGDCEERGLFSELDKSKLLRKKKRHRSVKPHRAVRSNDCRFAPSVKSGGGRYFMKARNHARIGRNRMKFEKPSEESPCPNVNYDSYYLNESNLRQYGFDDSDLAQFLIALQNGTEVTPEDYDRLLKLDEMTTDAVSSSRRNATAHLLASSIDRLSVDEAEDEERASTPSTSSSSSDTCAICMDSCTNDSSAKTLLCGHTFHADCLRHWWLSSPNMTCPLDNVDVRAMRPQMEGRITEPSGLPLRCYRI